MQSLLNPCQPPGLKLLDHIIVGSEKAFSLSDFWNLNRIEQTYAGFWYDNNCSHRINCY